MTPVTVARSTLALVLAALAACSTSSSAPSGEDDGSVAFAVTMHAALGSSVPVRAVWVHLHGTTARGAALDLWERAQPAGAQYTLSLARVPAGGYLVGGRAYSDAAALPDVAPDFETAADVAVTVTARAQVPVGLTLQQNVALHPPARSDDRAPTVDSLVASAQLVDSGDPGAAVALSATASDPDGPGDLTAFSWTAAYAPALAAGAAPGPFGTPAALATTWTPPAGYEGTVTVTFAAIDRSGARAALSLSIHVSPRGGMGSVAFGVDVNNFPDLGPVLAADAQPRPGAAVPLSVVARDPDGDPLSFVWDDGGCGGSFDAQGASSTTTWHAPAAAATCTLTVWVSDDRGASNRSTLAVHVRDAAGAFGPELVFATQSPGNPVAASGPVWFRVEVVEPTADPASPRPVTDLAWTADLGGAFEPVTAGDLSWVRWTPPPACAGPGHVPAAVTVTATGGSLDPAGNPNRTAFTFAVDLVCP